MPLHCLHITAPPPPFVQDVVDFQWCPGESWLMLSVSDAGSDDGGALQMWRLNDMLWRPEKEVLAELEQHRGVCWGEPVLAAAWEGAGS